MSWLSIPLPNPFKSLQFYDDEDDDQQEEEDSQNVATENDGASGGGGGGGVKEDLTAIGESISRQFRGVAAFLAPPPDEAASSSSAAVEGIRSDLAEIGGTFKNTLSLFSNPNNAVSHISKLASDFLQLNEEENSHNINNDEEYDDDDDDDDDDDEYDDDDDYGSGVTDQVIEFARQISDRPELWIDFPLFLQHYDFNMSEVQCEHASIVERLVPSLADLKNRISSYKSEPQFWMIYFILLLPRLNDNGLELLSTPQIIQTRETLLMMLQTKKNEEISPENTQSHSSLELDNEVDVAEPDNNHSVKDVTTIENTGAASNIGTNESNTTEKLEGIEGASTVSSTHCDTKTDDPELSRMLPSEVAKVHENLSHPTEPVPKRFLTDDDVSFSDLEDDDNDLPNREPISGSSQMKRNSSTEGSSDWVRLNEGIKESHDRGKAGSRDRESEGEDSTDWLTVDDFDP